MNEQYGNLLVDSSQLAQFERGFKSWCENTSLTIRKRLHLSKYSPLSPYVLAKYLNIRILTPRDIKGLSSETITYLTSSQGDEWSAITIGDKNTTVIIINPSHSERRQANTLMHELSHILRNHKSAQVMITDMGVTLRNYDKLQETEADWLAGSLLLPRDVLVQCHFRKYSTKVASKIFGTSEALFIYRMNISGVKRQFGNRH